MNTRFFIVVLTLYLSGCASSHIDFTGAGSLATDEGIIIGRVQLLDKGEEQNLSPFGESMFRVLLVPEKTSETIYVPLKGDGMFMRGNFFLNWRKAQLVDGDHYHTKSRS
jgi:hypothetical protein